MSTYLHYLSASQEDALLKQAVRQSFEPSAAILTEGEQRHALFFIRDGNVRIELEHPEFNIEIAKLGKGELFGEMSLLEGLPVSANVIADDRVEVDVCDAAHIADIFANDRELEGRFFKSLAYILSVRLRDTTLRGFP
jgi:CRP-like cAMP-binding protein